MLRFLLALASTTAMAGPALAQDSLAPDGSHVCAERKIITDSLAKDYSESPMAQGVSDTGNVVEVLTTKDGNTWTILLTMPDGTSCVLATGQSWEAVPQMAMGQPL